MQTEQDPDVDSNIRRTAVQWVNRVVNQQGEDVECIQSTGWKKRPETVPVVVSAIHGKSENNLKLLSY